MASLCFNCVSGKTQEEPEAVAFAAFAPRRRPGYHDGPIRPQSAAKNEEQDNT